ncbi:MAG TPA: molybdate ABC transporter substrate-binding protein [Gemmataceae bacterium]|jgi:molybdenum ABC transporter molybdate-binding protein
MSTDDRLWNDDWDVGLRLWAERHGQPMLGPGRVELLESIDRWLSISEAARRMGMSYRRAWLLVQSINAAAGEPLVVAAIGGQHGGGAHLTEPGRRAVAAYRELQARLQQAAECYKSRAARDWDANAVHVAAPVSLQEVLGELLAGYAVRAPAVRVRAVFGASDELADHLLAGARADLFLTADPRQLDRLVAGRLLEPEERIILAGNTLAAIGPANYPVSVRKPTDLQAPAIRRIVLAAPRCPLGGYSRAYLEDRHLYDALSSRVLEVDNSRAVLAAVRAGQADVGLAYGSDAARAADCRVLFRVRRMPAPILYAAALLAGSPRREQARILLDFLTSRAASACLRGHGFLPAPCRG